MSLTCTTTPFHFTTALGQTLTPYGQAHSIAVSIQDYQFTDSFLLLPVAGCDLVLGAQWLDTLGFIGWHFLDKFIVFFVNGKRHVLQGITSRQHSLDANDLMSFLPFDHLDLDTHNPLPLLHHLDSSTWYATLYCQ